MKFCYNCGAEIEEGDRFCIECGAELSLADVEEHYEDDTKQIQQIDTENSESQRQQEIDRRRREEEYRQQEIDRKRYEEEQRREVEGRQEEERLRFEEDYRINMQDAREKREEDHRIIEKKPVKKKTGRITAACFLTIAAIAAVCMSIMFIRKDNGKNSDSGDGEKSKIRSGKYYYGSVTVDYKYNGKDCPQFYLNDVDGVECSDNKKTQNGKTYQIILSFRPALFDWFNESGNHKAAESMYLAVDEDATSFEVCKLHQERQDDKTTKVEMYFESDSYEDYQKIISAIHESDRYHPDERRFMICDVMWNKLLSSNDISDIEASGSGSTGWNIKLSFNETGRQKYKEATGNNLRRCLMFVVDGELVSAPYITYEIDSDSIMMEVQSEEEAKKIEAAFDSENKYIPAQKHSGEVPEWCFIPVQKTTDFVSDRSNLPIVLSVDKARDIDISAGHIDRAIEWEENGIDDAKDILNLMETGKAIEVSYVSSTGCMWLIIDGDRVDCNYVDTTEENENLHRPIYNNSRNIALFTYEDIVRDTGVDDPSRWNDRLYFEADGAWKVFAVRVVEIDDVGTDDTKVDTTVNITGEKDENGRIDIPVDDLPKYFAGNPTKNEIAMIIRALSNVYLGFQLGQDGLHEAGTPPTRQEIYDYMFAAMEWGDIPDMEFEDGGAEGTYGGRYRIYSYDEVKTLFLSVFDGDEFDELAASKAQFNYGGEISKSNDVFTIWQGDNVMLYTECMPDKAYIEGDTLYIKSGPATVIGHFREDGTVKLEYYGSTFY